jgi:hypothetical protein
LKEPEVGAPNVDQLARGSLGARGNREERDDEADTERDARRGQGGSHRSPEQVLRNEADPRHAAYLR